MNIQKIGEANTATVSVEKTGARARVLIISPGKGSSGYYSAEVLAEAAPLFAAGTHMYLDHATESERWERPEGSLSKLVGVLESDATVNAEGGLEADVKIFPTHRDFIREAADYIGVSISASGEITEAEDGTPVVNQLTEVHSVDFVTKPGRGGKITALLEHKISEQHKTEKEGKGAPMSVTITEAEHTRLVQSDAKLTEATSKAAELEKTVEDLKAQLEKAQAQLAAEQSKAREAAVTAEAKTIIDEAFTGIDAPLGKKRLLERALSTEEFDAVAFREAVISEAAEYAPARLVEGMGKTHTETPDTDSDYVASVTEAWSK